MPWTPLHAALGEYGPDLSFELIERACAARIEEASDLDWKSALPLNIESGEGKLRQQAELAKDVAAMANSGGGMIVYGVAEVADPGSSAAERVEPVGLVDDTQLQQIRQVAGSLVFPPVVGIELYRLTPAEDAAVGVLAMVVPDSDQAPHLLHPRDSNRYEYFMAPYRHGPHTERMVEQQLAAAYRRRDQAARSRQVTLEYVWQTALDTLNDGRVWQVAVAVPEKPVRRGREFTRTEAAAIYNSAARGSRPGAFGAFDVIHDRPTDRGLQRYIRRGLVPLSTGVSTVTAKARAELHQDGTIVVATTRAGAFPGGAATGGDQEIAVADIEQVGADLLRLLIAAQRHRGLRSNYLARIGISRPTQIFRHLDHHLLGKMQPFTEDARVIGYRAVDGPILGAGDNHTLIVTGFDVIADAVNQTGASLCEPPRV